MYCMHCIHKQTIFLTFELAEMNSEVVDGWGGERVMLHPRRSRLQRRLDMVDFFGAGPKSKLLLVITLPNLHF